jgi:hypothetical protein
MMLVETIDFVEAYGNYVDARSATVFVGAGLSQAVGFPGWQSLLEASRQDLGVAKMSDLPQLAQYFVNATKDGRVILEQRISAAFKVVGEPPLAPSHRLLQQLPVNEFWTTNYDTLLERAISNSQAIRRDGDLARLVPPNKRLIYKMHGSIQYPGEIVITRDDYDRYPATHARFWHLLRAQFLTKTFLFLGFGFADPNLELVFKLVRIAVPDSKREHFAIIKRPDRLRSRTQNAETQQLFNLQMEELENINVRVVIVDDYSTIDEILSSLVARCRPPQMMIAASPPEGAAPIASGSAYPTRAIPKELCELAEQIGLLLADNQIPVVAGSELGAIVGYTIMRQLVKRKIIDDSRFTLIRRQKDEELDPPNLRLGRILFTGEKAPDLRLAALGEVRAMLVIGGTKGVQSEVDLAIKLGLGIIPVGSSGGTARVVWQRMREHLDEHLLGGRRIDVKLFDQLISGNIQEVADATARLVSQAMHLDA